MTPRLRFVLDNDVDAAVAKMLRRHGHEAWTIERAGRALVKDDDVTVYAHEQRAVVLTHDKEFSQRRRRNVIGKHVWLRCVDVEAVDLLEKHLDEVVAILHSRVDIWIRVSRDEMLTSMAWE